ncbi:DUF948 domain-containing protein [Paenibacillus chitinolyticus]|uniref:DUF948 domain-containing protein n=1 Tax=Paenibacillus chitinolyticus TaxID=79263 RepID=UPI003632F2D6
MTWVELSAVWAAIAFAILVWQAVLALQACRQSLIRLEEALGKSRQRLEETADRTAELLEETRELAAETRSHLRTARSVLDGAAKFGTALHEGAEAVGGAASALAESVLKVQQAVHTRQNRIVEAADWTAAGIELWRRWRKSGSEAAAGSSGPSPDSGAPPTARRENGVSPGGL